MDYKHVEYRGKVYDLTEAYTIMSRGKRKKMLKKIRKTLRCSEEEAHTIGMEIREQWLEDRSKSLQSAPPVKKRRWISGILAILIFLAALAGGAYYLFVKMPQNFEMEMVNDDAKTTWIGTASYGEYDDGRTVLKMMKKSDGQFFYLDGDETAETSHALYKTDLDTFNSRLEDSGVEGVTLDSLNRTIGTRIKDILGLDYRILPLFGHHRFFDDFSYWDIDDELHYHFSKSCFGGENPSDYYEDRELQLTCSKVTPKKLAIYTFREDKLIDEEGNTEEVANAYIYGLYKATVTTDHCKGDSVFPKEGKTKKMTVKVLARLSNAVMAQSKVSCYYLYFSFH